MIRGPALVFPDDLAGTVQLDHAGRLVAGDEGRIVGTIIAAWDGWRGSLYRLAVLPEQRRRGIATALVRQAEQRLATAGARRVSLIVVAHEEAAAAFWTAAGYEPQSDRVRHVRNLALTS